MLEIASDARIVVTTASSREEADRLARALVEERLAACATLIPVAESIYCWEGKIESSTETLLLLKTEAGCLDRLEIRFTPCTATPPLSFWCSELIPAAGLIWIGSAAAWAQLPPK